MTAVHSTVRADEEPIYAQLALDWGLPGQWVIRPMAVLLAAEQPRAITAGAERGTAPSLRPVELGVGATVLAGASER